MGVVTKSRKRLLRSMILPGGLAFAFLGYLTSEMLLDGRWINKVVFEDNWSESMRIVSFAIVALLIVLVSKLRYSELQRNLEYEERYEAILEKSPNGMLIMREGRILFMNSSARRVLGFEAPLIGGRTVDYIDLVDPRDRERVSVEPSPCGEDRPVDIAYECRFSGRGGEVVWARVSSFVIQHGGDQAALVMLTDITEGKRAEEQLVHSTRLAELGEMAASVAHELNQPLTGIRNFADSATYMLENGAGGEGDVLENLVMIREQVDRAARIINQMRDLSRRSEREFELLDLNEVVRESVDFLMHQLSMSEVRVEIRLEEGLPAVQGDRLRLTQVLLNILTNARQAMEEVEERELSVASGRDREKGAVFVEIGDTGPGFSARERGKIFSPFFSTKKPGQGTGLGLSISHTIVEEHDGWIESEAAPGKGAVFRVFLPAVGEDSRGGGKDGEI